MSGVIPARLLIEAAGIIRRGGVAILPTETFYCLAADPFCGAAVERIFAIKGRDRTKPLPLIAAGVLEARRMLRAPSSCESRLIRAFWPGSLTILLRPDRLPPPLLVGPDGRIGVRVPTRSPARTVAGLAGGWITATSANLSGAANPGEISDIDPGVTEAADMVLDLGPTPGGLPSTVVLCQGNDASILRDGAVPAEHIRRILRGKS